MEMSKDRRECDRGEGRHEETLLYEGQEAEIREIRKRECGNYKRMRGMNEVVGMR